MTKTNEELISKSINKEYEIKINNIYFDSDPGDYRVEISKKEIPPSHDWSIELSELYKHGFILTGITEDRYQDHIFIWVKKIE